MEWVLWWGVILVLLMIWFASWRAPDEEDDRDTSGQDPSSHREGTSPFMQGTTGRESADEPMTSLDPGQCPACGTDNNPFYSYCRECVSPLQ